MFGIVAQRPALRINFVSYDADPDVGIFDGVMTSQSADAPTAMSS